MKAHIKAHFPTNENIMIKLHIKVVIHSYCLKSSMVFVFSGPCS